MKPIRFDIFIEGELHAECQTLRQANSIRNKFEKEGWNVIVMAVYKTLVGELAKRA